MTTEAEKNFKRHLISMIAGGVIGAVLAVSFMPQKLVGFLFGAFWGMGLGAYLKNVISGLGIELSATWQTIKQIYAKEGLEGGFFLQVFLLLVFMGAVQIPKIVFSPVLALVELVKLRGLAK